MLLFWVGLALTFVPPVLMLGLLLYIHMRVVTLYIPRICRIMQEKPLFLVPRDQPREDAEVVRFQAPDKITLHGCYLKTSAPRKGVILFGLEFTSECWSCWSYCEQLLASGYDVFAFNSRNSGESEGTSGYEPMYWVTNYEVNDTLAAIAYLRSRPDADPRGIGFFGVSKGAGAGVLAACSDEYVRCCVTDGLFGTQTTLFPHMKQWFRIYNNRFPQVLIPRWYYTWAGRAAIRVVEQERHCKFPSLEKVISRLSPRPLLMIHGSEDSYIKPDTALSLLALAGQPKEIWMVEKAKHNLSLQVAGKDYHERILHFFDRHLTGKVENSSCSTSTTGQSENASKDARLFESVRS